jgi:hypothetical protein
MHKAIRESETPSDLEQPCATHLPRPSPKLMPSDSLPPTTDSITAPWPSSMHALYCCSTDSTSAALRGSLQSAPPTD